MGIEEKIITAITAEKSLEHEDLVVEALLYCEGLGDTQIRLYKQRFAGIYHGFQRYKAEHLVSSGNSFLDTQQIGNLLCRYLHNSLYGRKIKKSASLSKSITAVLDKERYKKEGVSVFGLQALYYCLALKEGIKTEIRLDIVTSKDNSKKTNLRQLHLLVGDASIPVSLFSISHIGYKVSLDVTVEDTVSTENHESLLEYLKIYSCDSRNSTVLWKKRRIQYLDHLILYFRDIHKELPSSDVLHKIQNQKQRYDVAAPYFRKLHAYLYSAQIFAISGDSDRAIELFRNTRKIKRESYYLFENIHITRKEMFYNYYKPLAEAFAKENRRDLAQEVLLEYYNFHKNDRDLTVYYKPGHIIKELFYEQLIETASTIHEELGKYFKKLYAKELIDNNIEYLGSSTQGSVTTYCKRGLQKIMDNLKKYSLVDDPEVLNHIEQCYKKSSNMKTDNEWIKEIISFFFQGEEQQKRIESLKD